MNIGYLIVRGLLKSRCRRFISIVYQNNNLVRHIWIIHKCATCEPWNGVRSVVINRHEFFFRTLRISFVNVQTKETVTCGIRSEKVNLIILWNMRPKQQNARTMYVCKKYNGNSRLHKQGFSMIRTLRSECKTENVNVDKTVGVNGDNDETNDDLGGIEKSLSAWRTR